MPVYNFRRRKRNLREQMISSKSKLISDDDSRSSRSLISEENSSTASLKGSFLRNKLENPLFKTFLRGKGRRTRRVKSVSQERDESDSEISEDDEGPESDSDTESDSKVEQERRDSVSSRKSMFWSSRSRRGTMSRGLAFIFSKKSQAAPERKSRLRLQQRNSSHSRLSQSSCNDTSDSDVDVLTAIENSCQNGLNEGYMLYNQDGEAVRVKFLLDYLQITPITTSFLSLKKSKKNSKPKVVYYEDLALWTNNDSCLRLVHIKDKNTELQHRSEIKLFTNSKKVEITPRELNEILKDRVSVLLASKLEISQEEARTLVGTNATDEEINKMVQRIDRTGKKCLAKSYTRDLDTFQLLNV